MSEETPNEFVSLIDLIKTQSKEVKKLTGEIQELKKFIKIAAESQSNCDEPIEAWEVFNVLKAWANHDS